MCHARRVIALLAAFGALHFPQFSYAYDFELSQFEFGSWPPYCKARYVEVMGASSYPGELLLVSERPFLRRTDGRIEFQPALAPVSSWGHPSERGLVGIPRILIRGGEER